eukprot:1157281-Pelagomonas_calceolata.AAC.1
MHTRIQVPRRLTQPLATQAAAVASVASAAGLGRHSLPSSFEGGGGMRAFGMQPAVVVRQRHLQPVVLLSAHDIGAQAVRLLPGKGDAEDLTEVGCVRVHGYVGVGMGVKGT